MARVTNARRVGAYAKLLANYASDDAIIAAGEAAELLFVRGLAFCATSDSDGYITDAQLHRFVGAGMRDTSKRARALVREGIWERIEGGYLVRSWLKIHPSSEERGYKRKTDRERKRAQPADGFQTESAPIPDGIREEGAADSLNCSVVTKVVTSTDQITTQQSTTATPLPAVAGTTAQTIIAEWIEHAPKRPPSQVVGQIGKLTGQMLAEGIDPDDVRRGLAAWMTKGLHPSSLPSVVNEVMNAPRTLGRASQKAATWLTIDRGVSA